MLSSIRDSEAKRRPVALVVAELGASWEAWCSEAGDAPVVTVVERPGDSPEVFAHRVRAAIEELGRLGRRIVSAVVVGGAAYSPAVLGARATVLRSLCASMMHTGGGRVLLAGPEGVRGAPVHAMAALAEIVGADVRGTGVTIAHREARPRARRSSDAAVRTALRDVA